MYIKGRLCKIKKSSFIKNLKVKVKCMKQFFLHFNCCIQVLAHSNVFKSQDILLRCSLVSYFTGQMKQL